MYRRRIAIVYNPAQSFEFIENGCHVFEPRLQIEPTARDEADGRAEQTASEANTSLEANVNAATAYSIHERIGNGDRAARCTGRIIAVTPVNADENRARRIGSARRTAVSHGNGMVGTAGTSTVFDVRRRRRVGNGAAGIGQATDQPVGLDRIVEPRFGPAMTDTTANSLLANFLAVLIKQRQLPARLFETALEPAQLRVGWHRLIAGRCRRRPDLCSRRVAAIEFTHPTPRVIPTIIEPSVLAEIMLG